MKNPSPRTVVAAAALAAAAVAAPVVGAPNTTDAKVTALEAANPVRAQSAEAAWWHVSVLQWRSICGYGGTTYLGQGYYSHAVKRWATTVYSSSTCILSGERMVNRISRPYWGMTGTLYGTPAWT